MYTYIYKCTFLFFHGGAHQVRGAQMQGATPELLQPGARMLRHGGGRKARMLELWRWPDAARAPPLGAQVVMKCELL